jgi:hypothetical protein
MITAEQIHNELWDLGLNRLADLKSTVVDNKAIETKRNLESLGFTQSETYKNLSKKVKKMEEKVVYNFFNQRFDGVVFVPTNDFVNLLLKYDLYCSVFEDFLGEIPEENIDEILDAKNTLTEIKDINVYSNRYKNLVSQISDSYIGEWCNEALLSSIDEEPYQEWKWNGRPDYYEALEIIENGWNIILSYDFKLSRNTPRSFYDNCDMIRIRWGFKDSINKFTHFPITELGINPRAGLSGKALSSDTLLIAAPRDEIKYIVELEEVPKVLIKDPFVFQVLENDVVIFSKWGVESKDELFEK